MSGGRPSTTNYEDLNFQLIKDNKKFLAYCNICKKTLHNTAASRLSAHRKRCTAPDKDDSISAPDKDDSISAPMDISQNSETFDIEEIEILDCGEFSMDLEQQITKVTEGLSSTTMSNPSPSSSSSYTIFTTSPSCLLSSISKSSSSTASSYTIFTTSPSCSSSSILKSSSSTASSYTIFTTSPSCSSSSILKSSSSSASSESIKFATPKPKTNLKNKKITAFVDQVTLSEIKEIESGIANFFFGCNISLNKIESPHYREMIRKLRPAYVNHIPSRKVLTGRLLNSAYESSLAQSRSSLPKDSVLLIDGWKNSANNTKTVVSLIHNTSSFTNCVGHFVNAWDCTGESETGDKLSEIVTDSHELARKLYNTEIYAVVSDNAKNMVRMGKNLENVIWHNTCNSHTANLLAKDISNKDIIANVNTILKTFKQSDLEREILIKGGRRIKLACETRWCSNRNACASLLSNLQHMKQIIIDEKPKKIKSTVSKMVFDEDFITDVIKEKEILDPICELINKCQSKETNIADAAFLWLQLKAKNMNPDILEKIDYRQKMALSKYALAAYHLHPNYDDKLLTKEHLDDIDEFLLTNLNNDGLEAWYCYKNKSGFFSVLFQKQIDKPHVFWATAEIKYKNLAHLALKLLNIPASSAQVERLFSNWGQIHCPIRNKLSFDHSKKLLHTYFSLNNDKNVYINDTDLNIEEYDSD